MTENNPRKINENLINNDERKVRFFGLDPKFNDNEEYVYNNVIYSYNWGF